MTNFSKNCGKYLFALVATFALVLALAFSGATTVNASGENIFPNGSFEDEGLAWYSNGGTVVLSTDEANTGDKSLKVSGHWVRTDVRGDYDNPNAIFTEIVAGVELGTIYNVSMYTKSNEGTTTLGASFILTVPVGESYAYPYINLFNNGTMYFYAYNANWTLHTSTFGFVREANNNIVALIDGVKVDLNSTAIGNINLDLGSNNGGSYFDDISMVKASYTTNAVITLKDGADVVTGKTIIIKDANGVALETQPEIVEDNGVYTVKNLTFNTLKDTYKFAIEGINGLADGVITAFDKNYELGISAYDATVTVKDENGTAITDATVTANVGGTDVTVTNNGDGTYSINELFNAVNVKVEKEGLIEKTLTLSADNSATEIVLKKVLPATETVGNLIVNGNFEGTLASGSQEPGKWNAEAGAIGITTENQQDGVYGLAIENRSAYRIDLGSIKTDGSKYSFSFVATSANAGTINLDLRPTVTTAAGGWGYPQVTLINAESLTNEFSVYEVEFAIWYDELEKTIKYAINGQETATTADITGVAAIDFVFVASNGAILDNVTCLNVYDVEFTVVDNGAQITEGLTFEVLDGNGKALDVTPVYSEDKWVITGVKGIITLNVTNGEKTYPSVVFDSRNTTATIEDGFDLTVTLKDNYGNAVVGANIVARKGAIDLFTMTDNGDGTYSYSGAIGSFNLYVTLEGYVFEVERNVTFENADITITATSSPVQGTESGNDTESGENNESKDGSGCGSSVTGSLASLTFALLGAMGVVIFRKKED